jgi:hypothetical protein
MQITLDEKTATGLLEIAQKALPVLEKHKEKAKDAYEMSKHMNGFLDLLGEKREAEENAEQLDAKYKDVLAHLDADRAMWSTIRNSIEIAQQTATVQKPDSAAKEEYLKNHSVVYKDLVWAAQRLSNAKSGFNSETQEGIEMLLKRYNI